MELVTAADMEAGSEPRDDVGGGLASGNGIVRQHQVHEVIQIDVCIEREFRIPDIESVARSRTREIDTDLLAAELALGGIDGIRQAV